MTYIPSPKDTNGNVKATLFGKENNQIEVLEINGHKGLVSFAPAHVSTENSTADILGISAFFTGTWEKITNFGIIMLTVYTDQVSATDGLEVQFSSDGINVDSTDCFTIPASTGKTFSFQAATKYFRVKYTNGLTGQSEFRMQVILKPYYVKPSSHRISDSISGEDDAEVVKAALTGEDPNGLFRNVGTQISGALRSSIEDGQTGQRAEVEPLGSLKTIIPTRVVGTAFSNGTKDPNFWTETVTGSGSVTQSGEIILSTGTTADSTVKYQTVRKARKITGSTNQFRTIARNVNAPVADCLRRIGAYHSTDGFLMQYDGTVFGVVSRKNSVDTVVTNGNFNGNAGATINADGTDFRRIVIEYTAKSAKFFIDGILIHTITATTASLANTLDLPSTIELINKNGSVVNNSYEVLFASILTLGKTETTPKSTPITTNTTTVLKYGAGVLQRIVNTNNAGTVNVYDNTVGSGTLLISPIDAAKALGDLNFNAPFNNGLTVVTTGGAQITVIYE